MKIMGTDLHGGWLKSLKAETNHPDPERSRVAKLRLGYHDAFLLHLRTLSSAPTEEDPPLLKRIRQARRHLLWRLGHPYDADCCVRLVVHFDGDTAVVALVGGDKRGVSDEWYDTATRQSEHALDHYYRKKEATS